MHPAKFAISRLEVEVPKTTQGLSMFPLRSRSEDTIDYLLLGDALATGQVTVREVSERGSVSDLMVDNRANQPVLIIDGEELVGAKQNRVVNLTLLMPAAKSTSVPVTCVEQGRWSPESNPFELSQRVHHSRGRAAKLASVQASMRFEGTRYSDQLAIWRDISDKARAMDASSPTGAMGALFEQHASALDEIVGYFSAEPEVCGGIFAIAGQVCGLDIFDKPGTFAALLPKLVRSYAIDALEHGEGSGPSSNPPGVEAAREFLSDLIKGDIEEHEAVGLGHDIRIAAPGTIAGGLLVDSSLLHMVAFAELPDRMSAFDSGEGFARSRHRRQVLLRNEA